MAIGRCAGNVAWTSTVVSSMSTVLGCLDSSAYHAGMEPDSMLRMFTIVGNPRKWKGQPWKYVAAGAVLLAAQAQSMREEEKQEKGGLQTSMILDF